METRDLGRTGVRVSALGFGCGSVGGLMVRGDPAEQRQAVARAIDGGVTYFDTAASYGDGQSEQNLGRTLSELGVWERVVVGTKLRLTPADGADLPAAVRRSCEASLQRLGHDSVDLLQLHSPIIAATVAGGRGLGVDDVLGAVAEGVNHLVNDGLVRHTGITGLGDTAAVHAVLRSGRFATTQAYFNAVDPSAGFAGASGGEQDFDGLIDVASASGLGVIAIRVMAAGALAAEASRPANAGDPGGGLVAGVDYTRDLERARALVALAKELGLEGPAELALRFALSKPGVSTALVGFSSLLQLDEALRWAERGPLVEDAIQRVVTLAR